ILILALMRGVGNLRPIVNRPARTPPQCATLKTQNRLTMRITRIDAYRVELPLVERSYKWSGGNAVSVFYSTVVAVSTDSGLTGYGEICPLGSAYLPAYARGVRAGIEELAPHLIGLDPTAIGPLN